MFAGVNPRARDQMLRVWSQSPRMQLYDAGRLGGGAPERHSGLDALPERWEHRETFAWLRGFYDKLPDALAPERASVRLRDVDLPSRQMLRNDGVTDGDIYHAGIDALRPEGPGLSRKDASDG